jgi:5-methylcytosine-specific restriction endonuclease McrA
LPNSRVKESQRESFIAELIGQAPSDALLALGTPTRRFRRLKEAEILHLEQAQCGRCALCGVLLEKKSEPHVDHIVPVSLGGVDDISNFQLLCSRCNLGKSASLHWLMLSPFFDEQPGNAPSALLRYAVLQRHGGRCFHNNCDADSSTSELHVVPRIPVAQGGRVIFDNLVVFCSDHLKYHQDEQYKAARRVLAGTVGGFSFGA